MDVLYVVTGNRQAQLLSDEHQALISAYLAAPVEVRKAVMAALRAHLQP